MLLEIAIGSAAGYGLARTHSPQKKFIEFVNPPAKTSLQKFKARYLDPFFGDSRRAHKQTLIGVASTPNVKALRAWSSPLTIPTRAVLHKVKLRNIGRDKACLVSTVSAI